MTSAWPRVMGMMSRKARMRGVERRMYVCGWGWGGDCGCDGGSWNWGRWRWGFGGWEAAIEQKGHVGEWDGGDGLGIVVVVGVK